MWHEARKQEKIVKNMMIDNHKRLERKNSYFKKLNRDPLQLIRIYGKKCNRYISDLSSLALDSQFLVSWNEDPDVLMDRFDARANLDVNSIPQQPHPTSNKNLDQFQYICNYERYRSIILFESKGISEEAYLQKLGKDPLIKKKNPSNIHAAPFSAVGYQYKDSVVIPDERIEDNEESDSEYCPPSIETSINLSTFPETQKNRLDELASHYGMIPNSFCSTLFDERKQLERLTDTKQDKISRKFKGISDYYCPDPALSQINYKLLSNVSNKSAVSKEQSESSSEENAKITENKVEFITEFSSNEVVAADSLASNLPNKTSSGRRSRLSNDYKLSYSISSNDSDDSTNNSVSCKKFKSNSKMSSLETASSISAVSDKSPIKILSSEKKKSLNLRDKLKQRTQDMLNNQINQDNLEKKRKETEIKKAQKQRDQETERLQKKYNRY